MSHVILTKYLNDHLAGSVAAIDLVEHLVELSGSTERKEFFVALRREIEQDQEVLKRLLKTLGGSESKMRKVAAWLTEKAGEAKLRLDDPGTGRLMLLERLEALGLGIQGKLALWRALGVASEVVPELRGLDLPALERRAQTQHQEVEAMRLEVARDAFRVSRR